MAFCNKKCGCGNSCCRQDEHGGKCDCDEHNFPKKITPQRTTWAETWGAIVKIVAETRSYDPRMKVGAIVVSEDNTQMLAIGYNGNYRGGPHEHESTDPGQSGFIHAELNALLKCDFNFPRRKIMYVTHAPCRMCAKAIINHGIWKVIYDLPYRDMSGVDLLKSAGVETYSLAEAILIERHEKASR